MALANGSSKELSTHDLLDAQAHVWNHMLNYINSMSLRCAIQLGIPDAIHNHGKPMTLAELVDALPIDKAKSEYVSRLMRVLVHSEFFTKVKVSETTQGYCLTLASSLLLKDAALSLEPHVQFVIHPTLVEPWHHLTKWLQSDNIDHRRPYDWAHGRSIWEQSVQLPQMNDLMNKAMHSDSRFVTNLLLRDSKYVFVGYKSLVDVGGGIGTTAKAIANAFPEMKCIVLDLPHVIADLEGTNNLAYLAGDMFDQAIPSSDIALLKWILHDWDDEACIRILKSCKNAIGSSKGGKVIIIDIVMDEQGNDDKAVENQLFSDMLMMVLAPGKERSEKQWSKLFYAAGFSGYKIIPALGFRSLIEVFP